MFKLASWNVNSLRVRLEQVLAWLETSKADVLALQETKVTDPNFPVEAFASQGFQVVYSGQKTYNGVAIVSRFPIEDVVIPDWQDPERRVLAASIAGIRLVNYYVPNGAAVGTEKYAYKLSWLKEATAFLQAQLIAHPSLAVVGDFNIAPEDQDVHSPAAFAGGVLVSPLEREAFQALLAVGLHDSFRMFSSKTKQFSWWDYRAAAFRRDCGARIDHILLSEPLRARCTESQIDVGPRQHVRPSDHAPVWVSMAI